MPCIISATAAGIHGDLNISTALQRDSKGNAHKKKYRYRIQLCEPCGDNGCESVSPDKLAAKVFSTADACIIPVNPQSPPESSMATIMIDEIFIPAYLAVSLLSPTTVISNPFFRMINEDVYQNYQ